jgi:transcription elongation factor Elf1
MVVTTSFDCAFCGETNSTSVDLSAGETQQYIEDCQVCCRPNNLYVTANARTGDAWIEAFTDDD